MFLSDMSTHFTKIGSYFVVSKVHSTKMLKNIKAPERQHPHCRTILCRLQCRKKLHIFRDTCQLKAEAHSLTTSVAFVSVVQGNNLIVKVYKIYIKHKIP